MLKPGNTPTNAPSLVLSPLLETTLSAPYGSCPLSVTQTTGLQILGKLWGKILSQLEPVLERNKDSLGSLSESFSQEVFRSPAPFLTSWPTLAQGSRLLIETQSPDSQEVRDLLNSLHETALLASLLGSFGVGPFVGRCVEQLSAVHSPPSTSPRFAKRLYQHPLTFQAINSQLEPFELPLLRAELFTPSLPENLRRGLNSFATQHAPLHSKEQLLVDESLQLLSGRDGADERIAIATSAPFTTQLTARLKARLSGAPSGFLQEVCRGLGDTPLSTNSDASRVLIAPVSQLLSLPAANISRVFLFSPLVLHSQRMLHVGPGTLAQLREHFGPAPIEILRTESPAYLVDKVLFEKAMQPAAALPALATEQARVPELSTPRPDDRAASSSAAPKRTRRQQSVVVSVPQQPERLLFGPQELSACTPKTEEPERRRPPTVDPATLPSSISELNARLGITLLKPTLSVRPDQLQPLFEMLEAGSLRWLIKAPTGFGKTPFACIVSAVILGDSPLRPAETRRGSRIVYVTPNVDLCAQVKSEFLTFLNLKDSDIAILNGTVPVKKRAALLADTATRIVVGTPETLRKAIAAAPHANGFPSVSAMIVDEFQSAEGNHPMACLVREAQAAGVPILVQSGTPARDDKDLREKQELVSLEGALVPKTLQPLKNHELLSSHISPERARLVAELNAFSFAPYIACREQLANAKSLVRQLLGQESPTLFAHRIAIQRKPHIESFGPPNSATFEKLKAKMKELRATVRQHEASLRAKGKELNETGKQALTDINLASLNIARMSSLVSRTALLANAGSFAFLHDFASTWIARYLEAPRRHGAFPAFQNFFNDHHFRSVVRAVAEDTPYIHLLQSPTCGEALERAFGSAAAAVPESPQQRKALFLQLALLEMSKRQELDHPKEAKLFARIDELHRLGQARGIIIFAEPRYLAKHLALRLHHRFAQRGVRVAFATGEGDGFADRFAASLESQQLGSSRTLRSSLGTWEEIRQAFQRKPGEPEERADIIVATSRLAVGHNLSAAAEAHIFSMHADAQKLIQQIGRVGRPDGDNFFGRVGQCYYHVTRNTPEWYLFLSAIKKYRWMRSALSESEAFSTEENAEGSPQA